ncbi:SGNH/GDSL hydrolase family protein [Aliikangiella maris]|uniref:SGNH/GDSL hydrolase family protein n=2 Tax=Aliikangiella maris TaxID=3162458 RepID=A0ABV2BXT9_9GAMM
MKIIKAISILGCLLASQLIVDNLLAANQTCSEDHNHQVILQEGKLDYLTPNTLTLEKGKFHLDVQTGLCIKRFSDHQNEPPQTFARVDYSRRQAYNADNSIILVYSMTGFWHIYDAKSGRYIKQLKGPASDAELIWDPVDPSVIYYSPVNGGLAIYSLNVKSEERKIAGNFKNRLPWMEAARIWTKSEGTPSADGRYWGFQVETKDFKPLGLIIWDKLEDKVIASWEFAKYGVGRPDHTTMSPSGEYIVASWDGNEYGTTAFSRDFRKKIKLHHKSEHSDLALLPNEHDAYISVDYQAPQGPVYMVELQTGERTHLFNSYIKGTVSSFHFSGKAYKQPGWVLVSTYGAYQDKPKYWLHDKIFAIELKASPRIFTLAYHHSIDQGYWTEPHATVNTDFSKVLFNSNWGKESKSNVDIYQIDLPDFTSLKRTAANVTKASNENTQIVTPQNTIENSAKKVVNSTKNDMVEPTFINAKFPKLNQAKPLNKILFVGNSLTQYHNIPEMLKVMAHEKGAKVEVDLIAKGGAVFADHIKQEKLKNKLKTTQYDVVVLQAGSYESIYNVENFIKNGSILAELVREHKATPIFYMTWHHRDAFKVEAKKIYQSFMQLSANTSVPIVPVGIGFAQVAQKYPDIELFSDGTHQSKLGAYFSALTFYSFLFNSAAQPVNYNPELNSNMLNTLKSIVDGLYINN